MNNLKEMWNKSRICKIHKMQKTVWIPTFNRYWKNELWYFTFIRINIIIDFRRGNLADILLTDREKPGFIARMNLISRNN